MIQIRRRQQRVPKTRKPPLGGFNARHLPRVGGTCIFVVAYFYMVNIINSLYSHVKHREGWLNTPLRQRLGFERGTQITPLERSGQDIKSGGATAKRRILSLHGGLAFTLMGRG